jgi:hypothetical protein
MNGRALKIRFATAKTRCRPGKGILSDEEIDELWHYIRANAYQK